jgi:hypothetical protein
MTNIIFRFQRQQSSTKLLKANPDHKEEIASPLSEYQGIRNLLFKLVFIV